MTTEADKLKLFRNAARGMPAASAQRVMEELYDDMNTGTRYLAEIWLAERVNAGDVPGKDGRMIAS